ncbi:MAG: HAMP domain-containing histidine kinase [Eubacterium sp.]|nr:HAMP domain-containing histidine kinase [Eubacterium sp.]
MTRTLRSRMVIIMTTLLFVFIAGLFIIFAAFADNFYYWQKLRIIDEAYKVLQKTDITTLKSDNSPIADYEQRGLTFVICDDTFERVYVTNLNKKPVDAQEAIKINILDNFSKYSEKYTTTNNDSRIAGYGIISGSDVEQTNYYVCIYEMKTTANIMLLYFRYFFIIAGLITIVVGILVTIYISGRITKPIKEIQRSAKEAVKSGFNITIDEKQDYRETSSLAKSMNTMLEQIRMQMADIQDELEKEKHQEQERRVFINNVSHELKTPLAIISSQVEMLRILDDEEKRDEYRSSIIEETEKMSEMINDMIVMYSAQSGNEELKLEETDISEMIKSMCEKYEDLFSRNGIVLIEELDEKAIAKVNVRFIRQAVGNYITNAIKHSVDGGTVTIRVLDSEHAVRVEVQNEGENVPEEDLDKIWDMFYSGDAGSALNGQGSTGIGLAIVKSVMEVHQGSYGVENLPERGVIFWIEIPKERI